jgi:APA family basic amino acid/polyamine antiporter
MIAIGSTIGSGIFLTPTSIARSIPDPVQILLAWTVGGITALSGALTFAELSALMPGAGGVYVYLSKAYGSLWGFLFGWAYLLVVNTGGIAALSIAFATYFAYIVPLDAAMIPLIAVAGLAVVTVVNVFGVKFGGIFADLFTGGKLLAIIGVIVVGTFWGHGIQPAAAAGSFRIEAFGLAMIGILWSYGGWQHATFAAAEAKNPRRTIPKAMIIGAGTVVLLYLLTNVAYLRLLSTNEIAASSGVAAEAIGRVFGQQGGIVIALAIFVSTFGTAGIYTLTAPRIYFAMADDRIFFPHLSRVHPRYHTPVVAILVQSAWALTLIFFWKTFENLISYVVFTDWIFFGLAGMSIFIFRRRHVADPAFRTPGYPWVPLMFVLVAFSFVCLTIIGKPAQAIAGLLFLASGIPVYFYWKRNNAAVTPPERNDA